MAVPSGMSGIPSAVGLCLESTFKTAPITTSGGNANTIGVSGTNPHRFMIMEPGGGFKASPEMNNTSDTEIDGDVQRVRSILEGKVYPNDHSFKVDAENVYYPLLGIYGRDVQTNGPGNASTQITSTFKHVFTPNKYFPSFLVEEIIGDGNYGRVGGGVIINALDLTFAKTVIGKMGMRGHNFVPNKYSDVQYDFGSSQTLIPAEFGGNGTKTWARTASPTFVDVAQLKSGNGPFVFAGLGFGTESGFSAAYVTIEDVAQSPNILPDAHLSLQRVTQSFMTGGSGFDEGAVVGNQVIASGSVPALFRDNTFQLAALSHSKVGINFLINGIYIGSSAQKYSIEVHLPHCKFVDVATPLPGGAIVQPGGFYCIKDPSLGYGSKVTVFNTISNASLGGAAGTTGAAGGGGGWNNT